MRLSPLTASYCSLSPRGSHSGFPPRRVCMCVASFEHSAGVRQMDRPRPVVKSGKTELDWQHLIRSKYKAAWEITSSYCFPFPAVHKKIRKHRQAGQEQRAIAALATLGRSPGSPNAHPSSSNSKSLPSWSFWHHGLFPCSPFIGPEAAFHTSKRFRRLCSGQEEDVLVGIAPAFLSHLFISLPGGSNFTSWIWSLILLINTLWLQQFQGFLGGSSLNNTPTKMEIFTVLSRGEQHINSCQ